VPYKGGSGAVNDLLGGHVQLQFGAISTSLPQIKAGRLRALGVTNPRRSSALPDVPAIAETVPGFEVVQWFGVFAPAGVPQPIASRLAGEIAAAASSPDVSEQFARQGVEPMPFASHTAYVAYVKKEIARWPKLLESVGLRPGQVQ
jgi:tripartite-type tricarboxylate transporter receptor subunit TctC